MGSSSSAYTLPPEELTEGSGVESYSVPASEGSGVESYSVPASEGSGVESYSDPPSGGSPEAQFWGGGS